MDPAYVAFTLGLLFTFTVYVLGEPLEPSWTTPRLSLTLLLLNTLPSYAGSGGSKPHLERSYFLWLYVPLACLLGSKVGIGKQHKGMEMEMETSG